MLVLLVAGDRVQVALGLKAPLPVEVKVAEPVGLDLVPLAVSLTVTVHRLPWLTTTLAGAQLTAVLVERAVMKVAVIEEAALFIL